MFVGQNIYKIDGKGRLPLPPRFRRELEEGVIVAPGLEKCLFAYPVPEFIRLAEELGKQALSNRDMRLLQRAFIGSAVKLDLDGQGRVLLSQELRKYAGINNNAMVIGLFKRIEVWDPDLWEKERTIAQEQVGELLERESTIRHLEGRNTS